MLRAPVRDSLGRGLNEQYPVQFSVDYPDRSLNRLTTFFRIFTVIPIAIVLNLVMGHSWSWTYGGETTTYVVSGVGFLFLPPLVMILFRRSTHGGGSTGTSSCCGSAIASGSTWH